MAHGPYKNESLLLGLTYRGSLYIIVHGSVYSISCCPPSFLDNVIEVIVKLCLKRSHPFQPNSYVRYILHDFYGLMLIKSQGMSISKVIIYYPTMWLIWIIMTIYGMGWNANDTRLCHTDRHVDVTIFFKLWFMIIWGWYLCNLEFIHISSW